MQSPIGVSLRALVSEVVGGNSLDLNSSRTVALELCYWMHHASDFANSLMQDTSQEAVGCVSGSGKRPFHAQCFCRGAAGKHRSGCNEGSSETRLVTDG